jgi:hypothetical protein
MWARKNEIKPAINLSFGSIRKTSPPIEKRIPIRNQLILWLGCVLGSKRSLALLAHNIKAIIVPGFVRYSKSDQYFDTANQFKPARKKTANKSRSDMMRLPSS